MKADLRFKRDRRGRWLDVHAPQAEELAFLGAAYLLTDRACVVVGSGGAARLVPSRAGGLPALEREFALAYENQRLRWALVGRGEPAQGSEREAAAEGAAPAALSRARVSEIERLLAGADSEPAASDPFGIRRPWEDLRK